MYHLYRSFKIKTRNKHRTNYVDRCRCCKKELTSDNWYASYKKWNSKICVDCLAAYRKTREESNSLTYKKRRDKIKENPKDNWSYMTLWSHKKKGFIVNITREELYNHVSKINNCEICNKELTFGGGCGFKSTSATLDRKDNENELNINNVQVLCRKCNSTKLDRSMSEFIEYCQFIVNKFKKD